MAPTVSIVVPHYNDGPHLEALLRSVLAQSVRPHEVVIADDASTEPLSAAVLALAQEHAWIKLQRFPNNVGPVANTNRAVGLASGDVLVPRSANDLLDPGYLARLTEALARFPNAPLLATSVTYFATSPENGTLEDLLWGDTIASLTPEQVAESLTEHHLIHGVGLALNRHELARIGGFDEALRWYADLFATLRIILERGLVYIPGNGGFFRMNPDSYGNALAGRGRHQEAVLEALLDRVQAASPELKTGLQRSGVLGLFGPRLLELAMQRGTPEATAILPLLAHLNEPRSAPARERLVRLSPLRHHIRMRLRAVRDSLSERLAAAQPASSAWIYGAGSFGEAVLDEWTALGLPKPAGFLISANQFQGPTAIRTIAGLPVACVDQLEPTFTGLVVLASKSYEAAMHQTTRTQCPQAKVLSFYENTFSVL